jgi:hypothetical protein
MGCRKSPNAWRMPIDSVTMMPPQRITMPGVRQSCFNACIARLPAPVG